MKRIRSDFRCGTFRDTPTVAASCITAAVERLILRGFLYLMSILGKCPGKCPSVPGTLRDSVPTRARSYYVTGGESPSLSTLQRRNAPVVTSQCCIAWGFRGMKKPGVKNRRAWVVGWVSELMAILAFAGAQSSSWAVPVALAMAARAVFHADGSNVIVVAARMCCNASRRSGAAAMSRAFAFASGEGRLGSGGFRSATTVSWSLPKTVAHPRPLMCQGPGVC